MIPGQRHPVKSIQQRMAEYWRACGLTEGEIAEALSHLIVEISNDGVVTVRFDDPNWSGAG